MKNSLKYNKNWYICSKYHGESEKNKKSWFWTTFIFSSFQNRRFLLTITLKLSEMFICVWLVVKNSEIGIIFKFNSSTHTFLNWKLQWVSKIWTSPDFRHVIVRILALLWSLRTTRIRILDVKKCTNSRFRTSRSLHCITLTAKFPCYFDSIMSAPT